MMSYCIYIIYLYLLVLGLLIKRIHILGVLDMIYMDIGQSSLFPHIQYIRVVLFATLYVLLYCEMLKDKNIIINRSCKIYGIYHPLFKNILEHREKHNSWMVYIDVYIYIYYIGFHLSVTVTVTRS
jgi:hypothetical protein